MSPQPGPQDYQQVQSNWKKSYPTTFKFRHGFYYDEIIKHSSLSSKQYNIRENKLPYRTRFENIGIGIGLGNRLNFSKNDNTPGPGNYNLPSIFDKTKKTKYALN
jgi:hypothetical protein